MIGQYPDVFPKDLPGLPPDREIKFFIELVPKVQPVSIVPYRMRPAKFAELNT